jgi:asparagine synthase (glutamine-hydrolysing)
MCGIAGLVDRSDADRRAIVQAMLDRIGHRGPDDRGLWMEDDVALGHVRLGIIDPSPRGHQPFATSDGLGILSYNGEVYNFKELRSQLEDEGVRFRSGTDSEVVLYALHRWGPERAVARLNGMFAFSYYDRRDRSLWLGRDRMGIKPLYLAEIGDALAFASEAKALFAHPDLPKEMDEQALITLLLYERFEGRMTPYRRVQALLPGTLCRIHHDLRRCWTTYFDVLRDVDPSRILENEKEDFTSIGGHFEHLLRSSVHKHLVSDVPLATMCSGGLDSSLITAFAKERKPDLVSYVADVEGMNGEEVRRSRTACDSLNVELRVVDVDADEYFRALPFALASNDQPLYFSQGVVALVVARAMRRDGYQVVLTGDGADELFGGYKTHAAAHRAWRRRRLHSAWIGDNRVSRWLGRLHPAFMPRDLEKLARAPLQSTHRGATRVNELNVLLIDGARRHLREARLFEKFHDLKRHEDRAFLTSSFEDIYVHLQEYLRTSDRMSMHSSVENRVPFLENELIDFALHLPVSAKYSRGVSKRIVRHLAEKHLPAGLVDLPKIGFGMRASMWDGLLPFLRDGKVADLLKWDRADQQEILSLLPQQRFYQFRLLGMELWLRMNIDGEAPEELSEELIRMKRMN